MNPDNGDILQKYKVQRELTTANVIYQVINPLRTEIDTHLFDLSSGKSNNKGASSPCNTLERIYMFTMVSAFVDK